MTCPGSHSWPNLWLQALAPPTPSLHPRDVSSCTLVTAVYLAQAHLPQGSPALGQSLHASRSPQPQPAAAGTGRSSWGLLPPANELGSVHGQGEALVKRPEMLLLRPGGTAAGARPWAWPLQCLLSFPRRPHISAWYATGVRARVQLPSQAIQVNSSKGFLLLLPPSPLAGAAFVFPNGKVSFTFPF